MLEIGSIKMNLEAKPCVIGLGKLGLPLAAVLADVGYEVLGIDLNSNLINNLNDKSFSSPEPELNDYLMKNQKKLKFEQDYSHVNKCNIFFVIVPTPSAPSGAFDEKYLLKAVQSLLEALSSISGEKTLVIVSTVMPTTCSEKIKPLIQNFQNLNSQTKINLIYSPEFIALGSVIHNLKNPDMTLVGCENSSDANLFLQVMSKVTSKSEQVELLTLNEAEIVKILVNCFVTMKISFANFIGEIASAVPSTEAQRIARALGLDSRIGGKYLRPGLGFAGPCFPRDNKALIAFSKMINLEPNLAIATDQINSRQPQNVLNTIIKLVDSSATVGIYGLAYKPFTTVLDESQTLKIADYLASQGYSVLVFDPLVKGIQFQNSNINEVNFAHELASCSVIVIPKEFYVTGAIDSKLSEKLLVL